MNVIEEIKQKLKKYPEIKFEEKQHHLMVLPNDENGFHVSIDVEPNECVVSFDAWHEHFEDPKEALR